MALNITGDADADALLDQSPFALLTGMLLDQQVPMETAFAGPAKLRDRLGSLDPATIAATEPERLTEVMKQSPAVHRFPGSMAKRLQEIARIVVEEYDGDTSRIWSGATDGKDLLKRVQALPGFGAQKAKIFVALLAKQLGVRPEGWEKAAGDYALDGFRSVADVVDPGSLQKVRDHKKMVKAAAKESVLTMRKLWDAREKASEAKVKAGGAQVNTVDKKPFIDAMKPVYDKFVTDPKLKEMVAAIQAVN